ncbi:MAG: NYN domain-containing protein [Sphaerochaetaceae bacterium]|nr:NYN domain-containing protein [Sphaerochaetaceae bacterium]
MSMKEPAIISGLRTGNDEDTVMKSLQRIAVLIDADNTQLSKLDAVIAVLSAYGRIAVKKAYGNWKRSGLKNWENEVKHLAIKTIQQFDYVSGKNTTDIVMTIDAMDLLHTNIYDAFALVSSDSDFTPLAIRLRESGAYILGVGEKKTPEAFRNACDEFILLEHISDTSSDAEPADAPALPVQEIPIQDDIPAVEEPPRGMIPAQADDADIDKIHSLLRIASDKYQDADGFVNISAAGTYIKRVLPDFTPLTYGYAKLPKLVAAFPERYQMKKYKGKGRANIIAYRCLDAEDQI